MKKYNLLTCLIFFLIFSSCEKYTGKPERDVSKGKGTLGGINVNSDILNIKKEFYTKCWPIDMKRHFETGCKAFCLNLQGDDKTVCDLIDFSRFINMKNCLISRKKDVTKFENYDDYFKDYTKELLSHRDTSDKELDYFENNNTAFTFYNTFQAILHNSLISSFTFERFLKNRKPQPDKESLFRNFKNNLNFKVIKAYEGIIYEADSTIIKPPKYQEKVWILENHSSYLRVEHLAKKKEGDAFRMNYITKNLLKECMSRFRAIRNSTRDKIEAYKRRFNNTPDTAEAFKAIDY